MAPQVPMDTPSSTMAAYRLAVAMGGVAGEDDVGTASVQAAPSHATRPTVARPPAASSLRAPVAPAGGQVFRAAPPRESNRSSDRSQALAPSFLSLSAVEASTGAMVETMIREIRLG
eukprot:TRINITY_DN16764_c0_g2_i4.p2 TRINITY_DN16764_c0_g2~~TRINITY_DN16764_c0_g2_i4.p2  ORF type:complete len:117 (+),score=13.85 TRINITY_DN16764_c0_g2_i4:517-867(+)